MSSSRVAPLAHKLGVLFLQLPPRFDDLERLRAYLTALPRAFRYAVELRHQAARDGALELLGELGVDLVIMDARGIHSSKSLEHADTRARKPNLPIVMRATGPHPLERCVPHESFEASRAIAEQWCRQIATWIGEGKEPYLFMHAPDDTFAPENAYAFHALLRAQIDVGELPVWPSTPRQQSLF